MKTFKEFINEKDLNDQPWQHNPFSDHFTPQMASKNIMYLIDINKFIPQYLVDLVKTDDMCLYKLIMNLIFNETPIPEKLSIGDLRAGMRESIIDYIKKHCDDNYLINFLKTHPDFLEYI